MNSNLLPLALVTGTSRGLGAALAQELVAAGWEVHGFARGADPEGPEQAGDSSHTAGAYQHHRLDLTDVPAVEATFEQLAATLQLASRPRIGLVNNAALLDLEPTDETELTSLVRSYTVNSAVPTWLMGWCLRHTPGSTPLRIVNLSSGAASSAYPGWSAYCGTKAALAMAGEVLAVELEERPQLEGRDVALLSFAPGVVATDMQAVLRAADPARFPRRARFEELHERGELVPPAEPARRMARFLAADDVPTFGSERYSPPKSQH